MLKGIEHFSKTSINICSRRFYSQKPDVLVLDPLQARIVRKRRPKAKVDPVSPSYMNAMAAEIDQYRQTLFQEPSDVFAKDHVAQSINDLRPDSRKVTSQNYRDLIKQLEQGYNKPQLVGFLKSNGANVPTSWKKSRVAQAIIDNVWKLETASKTDSDDDLLVEKIISLSERDFVLSLGSDGALLREWAKSGAKISVNPDKRQLIIKSSIDTYNWILVSLHKLENNVKVTEIDFKQYSTIYQPSKADLNLVQRLSNTYITFKDFDTPVLVYSRSLRDGLLAKRLLLKYIQVPSKWSQSNFSYDTNHENMSKSQFVQYNDEGSLSWIERPRSWYRWALRKTRTPLTLEPAEFRPLVEANFQTEATSASDSLEHQIQKQITALTEKVESTGPVTITATFGHILHEFYGNYPLPNAGMAKIFGTNIPLISKWAGDLPYYGFDTAQEAQVAEEPESKSSYLDIIQSSEPDESTETDSWKDVLNTVPEPVYATKRVEQIATNTRMLQIKLRPSPYQAQDTQNLAMEYPPVEIWCPLQGERIDGANATAVSIPKESSEYVSLPDRVSDLRYSVATTSDVEQSDSMRKFLSGCIVNSRGSLIIPPEVILDINGQQVPYLYHSAAFQTQAELDFNGNMLQISLIDGGSTGGRRIEANLVLHYPGGKDDLVAEDLSKFVSNALQASQSIGTVNPASALKSD